MIDYLRVILPDEFELRRLVEVAADEGWIYRGLVAAVENEPVERIWISGSDTIHFVSDPMINTKYLIFEGKDRERLGREISKKLGALDREAAKREARSAKEPEEIIRAIYHIGLTEGNEPSPETLSFFLRAFAHPQPQVRRAALICSGFATWKELEDAIAGIQANDPSSELRDLAAVVLDSLEKHHWGRSSQDEGASTEG